MDTQQGEEPPKSTDLEGWRKAIEGNRLKKFRLEALAAAFQDLGHVDQQIQHALAKRLSDSIVGMLRKRVGSNHPNGGEDIIYRVHGEIFVALMSPRSADGKALRRRFGSLVLYRMKDAIAKEQRERRTPDDILADKKLKKEKAEGVPGKETVDLNASVGPKNEETEEIEAGNDEEIKGPDADDDDGLIGVDERLDVERILDSVSDERKRLAFHLSMNGVPFKTKRKNVESIADALGISERTAREWVKEVQLFLAQNDGVKHLRNLRAGERS
jgi:DNA-directed RNA polymerase specialized sigma24 family protein